ncbi:hypothetical protein Kpol_1065p21 [Vanderwaltozyma polyspora DSM 70294]|uniref:NEDD8-activating enzyme E1 catalytic subunit n=1 Tax=Vanderwaltozyma polyspora (strain ATCC 22028 / DSM 70294 / BCRC 21397 / CBS 2163 / NBRC 10782 / NRRL Y-8283 / UCD 57-17) TaxID=436907 RepID=A7TL43_VANPO|nr:uncharacterized protein Kpol_1065p21 [Vanderwaltozyma polyspora DSM 70294]EDO17006.1 hypothetical protein Kpol_1065p21 [Vanderwaltozyma polyspora DSM 70294]
MNYNSGSAITIKILILGAGGLGSEILKNLIPLNKIINEIHIIDFDTIELTNLNRQFLFNENDIGKPKAIVAKSYFDNHFPDLDINIIAHNEDIFNLSMDFIQSFNFVISGLDSIEPRRFINQKILQLTKDSNYNICIPFIDGGTEGFKGHVKTIIPGITSCWECSIDTLPSIQETVPMCTIANNPRSIEHIIQYVINVQFTNANLDDKSHLDKLLQLCIERANQFNITIDEKKFNVNYILGVIKKIIPSVSTTNAIIAGQCCNMLIKIYYDLLNFDNLKNFSIYNGSDSVFNYVYVHQRNPNCTVCSSI